MNNGQLNLVSMQSVMSFVNQEPSLSVAVTMEGEPQQNGDFAGLLNGLQLLTKTNIMPDSGQMEPLLVKTDANQAAVAAVENQMVDLLAQFQTATDFTPVLETAAEKSGDNEAADLTVEPLPMESQTSDFTPQMVMAAYSQPGRMPEVNILTESSPDLLQNVTATSEPAAICRMSAKEFVPAIPASPEPAITDRMSAVNRPTTAPVEGLREVVSVTAQPKIVSVPPIKIDSEQTVARPLPTAEGVTQLQAKQAAELLPAEKFVPAIPASPEPATTDRMSPVNRPATAPVEGLREVVSIAVQPKIVSVPPIKIDSEQTVARPLPTAEGVTQLQAKQAAELLPAEKFVPAIPASPEPAITDKMSAANRPATAPVEMLREVVSVTAQSEVVSVSPVKIEAKQVVAETKERLAPEKLAVASAEKPVLEPVAEQNQKQSATDSGVSRQKASTVQEADTLPLSSTQETEIQISQPQPILARVAATVVLAQNSLAGSMPQQQPFQENQNGRVKAKSERGIVKEMTLPLQPEASKEDLVFASDISQGSGNNQSQFDTTSDNQSSVQDIRGLIGNEQQKVSATSNKISPQEPTPQEIPEQVLHQVKERLAQHDLKQGNQQITLTLSPDSLGELKMSLNLQGQNLNVEIIAENRTVRDVIVQHTEALKESLARQNITMESFDVTTGGKGSANQGQNQNAWRELAKQQQQQQFWASAHNYQAGRTDFNSSSAAYQKQQGQSMLDIHY